MGKRILIAEDDKDISEVLSLYLTGEGMEVRRAYDGGEALRILREEDIDLALVDIMMPVMDGYQLIRELRTFSSIPVIIVSAKSMGNEKILGMNIGADAYLTKPFDPLEVVAYVKAALRRADRFSGGSDELSLGDLRLDLNRLELRKNGELIPLTSSELKILKTLMQAPGRVFTKAQLYESISGEEYHSDDNTMMVHISNLRAKIEDDPSHPRYIKTLRGLGYKIEG